MLTILYAILFYGAALVLIGGIAYRVWEYSTTPAPLKIPTTPAPVTRRGVVMRLAREVVLFESLFKANKWIWLFGWIFHAALLLVVLRHLRYFEAAGNFMKWIGSPDRTLFPDGSQMALYFDGVQAATANHASGPLAGGGVV